MLPFSKISAITIRSKFLDSYRILKMNFILGRDVNVRLSINWKGETFVFQDESFYFNWNSSFEWKISSKWSKLAIWFASKRFLSSNSKNFFSSNSTINSYLVRNVNFKTADSFIAILNALDHTENKPPNLKGNSRIVFMLLIKRCEKFKSKQLKSL